MSVAKSALERSLQAIGFELGGIAVVTPLFAWLMDLPWQQIGGLAVANCLLALLWNVGFNAGFDRILGRTGWTKTPVVRVWHAVLFEGGLMLVCLPLAMAWLALDFWGALKLDIGLNAVFLPYTYLYHWLYDMGRVRLLGAA
jgi:uncharacterized membrane protein